MSEGFLLSGVSALALKDGGVVEKGLLSKRRAGGNSGLVGVEVTGSPVGVGLKWQGPSK